MTWANHSRQPTQVSRRFVCSESAAWRCRADRYFILARRQFCPKLLQSLPPHIGSGITDPVMIKPGAHSV